MRIANDCCRQIILIATLGVGGCGLSDYQSRMDDQRKRVQEFDELNRLLDEPIDRPRLQYEDLKEGGKKDKPGWPFDIFLRLPKGYGIMPKEKTPYNYMFPCYRFAGGSEGAVNIFIAAADIQVQDPKADKEKEKEPDDPFNIKYYPNSFRIHFKYALQDFYKRTYEIDITFPDLDPKAAQTKEVKLMAPYPSQARIPFKWYTYSDEGNKLVMDKVKAHSVFDIYLREDGARQIAIAVQRPLRPVNPVALNKSIEASLGTLDITNTGAGAKRYFYKQGKG